VVAVYRLVVVLYQVAVLHIFCPDCPIPAERQKNKAEAPKRVRLPELRSSLECVKESRPSVPAEGRLSRTKIPKKGVERKK
jgi:hypothetical protein